MNQNHMENNMDFEREEHDNWSNALLMQGHKEVMFFVFIVGDLVLLDQSLQKEIFLIIVDVCRGLRQIM